MLRNLKTKCVTFLLFFVLPLSLFAEVIVSKEAVGKPFPKIQLECLVGTTPLFLPQERATLLVFCFEKECAEQARDWVSAIRSEKLLPAHVGLYIVPVVGNTFRAKLLKPFIVASLKRRIPKSEHDKVAMFVKDGDILRRFVGFEEHMKEHVFLTLVNKKGVVAWQHAGDLTTTTRNELKKQAAQVDK